MTRTIRYNDPETASLVAKCLDDGGMAIVPTDTLYGLMCDSAALDVVNAIYRLKCRATINPMAMIVSDVVALEELVILGHIGRKIVSSFLPGPLTIVGKYRNYFDSGYNIAPNLVHSNGNVGLRIPNDDLCLQIARILGRPIVATSVNISNQKPSDDIENIPSSIRDSVDFIVDGRQDMTLVPSTVIDVSDGCNIIREGSITSSEIKRFLSNIY